MTTRIPLIQRHSHKVLLMHIVWTTASRAPELLPSADAWLAAVLRRKAYRGGYRKTVAAHPDASSAKEETRTQVLPRR